VLSGVAVSVTRAITIALIPVAIYAQGAAPARPASSPARHADVVYEATISELQAQMAAGRTTSVELVDAYLARIAAYDHAGPALNAVIRLDPHARARAAALDAERKAGRVRGPLHGIPVILKDNYSTSDMPTSASSVALATLQTPNDAFQVKRLRDAGAVILGKSNMHELAAGITSISSLGGQTCNPYNPDRNPGGSSGGSGAAVAASFAAVAWGSDTCGSIRIPSAVHNLFGLRPTKGLSSIAGIVPLSHSQDVGGPIARTVMDLAIALDATVGPDTADAATRLLDGQQLPHFVESLDSTSLRGKRFAVMTSYFGEEADDQEGARVVRSAIEQMKARGATFVDVAIPGLDSIANRASVIDFEFKYDLIDFLATIPGQHVSSLSDILRLGMYDVALEPPFRRRDSLGTRDNAAYREALARRTAARNLVIAFLDSNRYDALVYPTMRRKAALIGEVPRGATCTLSAVTGLPALSMPAGFTPDGMPIGIEFLGRPLADAKLVALAFDYEQSAHPRRPPSTTPPLVDGRAPKPLVFAATVRGGSSSARGDFVFDPTRRTLTFDVQISATPIARVYAVSIARDSSGKAGPILHRLAAQGALRSKGSLILDNVERRDLIAGRLVLAVFASENSGPVVRTAQALSPQGRSDASR
jgi:Asp-tRNA(Asn)/Glu-tRNA(Gln) amidotransferase A subunit family amidase